MQVQDVIVIGGGPSGSTAASLLADKGYKVLLLEKERFPREHVGESLIPSTYEMLNKLGVVEDMKKIATRKPGVNFVNIDGTQQSLWCFKSVIKDPSYLSFHVVRSVFDKMLLDNSKKKGATVMEETLVKHVLLEQDGLVEVHTVDRNGEARNYKSKFIIDASGQNTFLASKLGVKKAHEDLDRVALFTHWSNTSYDKVLKEGAIKIIYLGGEKKGWLWVIPVSADHLSIGVVLNNSYVKAQKEKFMQQGSANWKQDLYMQEVSYSFMRNEILKDAKTDHSVQMIGDYSYHCTNKYGSNYAMIGDAGAFLDPIFSSGIYVGMHSAQLVADAIHQKLSGGDSEAAFTAAYTQINGAVKLLEKFIRLFYTPEALNFSTVGPEDLQFGKFEMAYSIFHYLLAGDFFKNHEKYSEFIDIIRDQKALAKFQNLIDHSKNDRPEAQCGETFEEMYGEMTHVVEFDEANFK